MDWRRWVIRINAGFDALIGVLFLAAPLEGLYAFLGLPRAEPALYGQLLGGLLVGYGYLQLLSTEWDSLVMRQVAGITAAVNLVGAGLIVAWVLSGTLIIGVQGVIILLVAAVLLTAFAIAEGIVFSTDTPRRR